MGYKLKQTQGSVDVNLCQSQTPKFVMTLGERIKDSICIQKCPIRKECYRKYTDQ